MYPGSSTRTSRARVCFRSASARTQRLGARQRRPTPHSPWVLRRRSYALEARPALSSTLWRAARCKGPREPWPRLAVLFGNFPWADVLGCAAFVAAGALCAVIRGVCAALSVSAATSAGGTGGAAAATAGADGLAVTGAFVVAAGLGATVALGGAGGLGIANPTAGPAALGAANEIA